MHTSDENPVEKHQQLTLLRGAGVGRKVKAHNPPTLRQHTEKSIDYAAFFSSSPVVFSALRQSRKYDDILISSGAHTFVSHTQSSDVCHKAGIFSPVNKW